MWGLTDLTSGHFKQGCQESGTSYQKSCIPVGLRQRGPRQEGVARFQSTLSFLYSVTILGDSTVSKTDEVPRAVTPMWESDGAQVS